MRIFRINKRFQHSSMLIAIFLGSAIYLAAWAQGGKSVASPAAVPKATPPLAPSATSSVKPGKSFPIVEPQRADMSIALTVSGKQGQLGPIECLQYELHMLGAKPGLASAKDQELKVTIKVDKTTPYFSAIGKTGELFQNVTLSNSAQTPAFQMRLTDAFVAGVSRHSDGSKRNEDLEDVTFKFAGLEVSRGNR